VLNLTILPDLRFLPQAKELPIDAVVTAICERTKTALIAAVMAT
jgi:hypothetical protein